VSAVDARLEILRKVNRFVLAESAKRTPPFPAHLLGSRQIQQAVRIARHNRLVPAGVLLAAGFRA
jgi:hypothetical protein